MSTKQIAAKQRTIVGGPWDTVVVICHFHFKLISVIVVHQRSSSIKGCCPSKVIFHQRLPSIKGYLHQMSTFIKGCLPSRVVFHQMSSSIKGCLRASAFKSCLHQRSSFIKCPLPSKVNFHLMFSPIKGSFPSKALFYWRSSSIKLSRYAKFQTCSLLPSGRFWWGVACCQG